MAIELNINGYFDLTIYNFHTGEEVDKETEQGVLDNLQQGEYLMGLESKTISDINDLSNPIYKIEITPTDAVSYEFEEN